MGESTNCWSGGTGKSTNCRSGRRESRLIVGRGRESLLIVGVADGRSTNCWSTTNCWSGGRESRLIVGVADGRVD